MTSKLKRQFWEGLVVTVLGAVILVLTPSQMKGFYAPDTKILPSFVPNLTGAGFLITGVLISLFSFLGKAGKKEESVSAKDVKSIGIVVLILLAYAFLFPIIGFVTTSAIFIGILSLVMGQRNVVKLLALMILVPVLVWLVFEVVFASPLPHGWLF